MSFPLSIKLYGSNTKTASTTPDKTTVEALADVVTMDITANTINSTIILEGENKTDINGLKSSKRRVRAGFEINVATKSLPATATALQTFYSSSLYKMKYHYLWVNDYTLPDTGVTTSKCLLVAIIDAVPSANYEKGGKDVIITLEKATRE